MKTINISRNMFRSLDKLVLNPTIFNTEAEIFVIPAKSRWLTEQKLLKKLYADVGDTFGNKLLTVNALIDRRELIDCEEMVLPERIAIVNDDIIGFTMPYIRNENMDIIMQDPRYPFIYKRKLLKEAGEILEKMKVLRDHDIVPDFYINDVHEGNFILNLDTGRLNIVDLDSCKIAGNKPFAAKYLTPFSPIRSLNYKYIVNNDVRYPGYIDANLDSDLYCYNLMVLNHLFGDKANKMRIDEFFCYLDYLKTLGYSHEALDCFFRMYENTNNVSVLPYIDSFPTDYETVAKSKKTVFQLKMKK